METVEERSPNVCRSASYKAAVRRSGPLVANREQLIKENNAKDKLENDKLIVTAQPKPKSVTDDDREISTLIAVDSKEETKFVSNGKNGAKYERPETGGDVEDLSFEQRSEYCGQKWCECCCRCCPACYFDALRAMNAWLRGASQRCLDTLRVFT